MIQADLGRPARPVAGSVLATGSSGGGSGRDVAQAIGAGARHGYAGAGVLLVDGSRTRPWAG